MVCPYPKFKEENVILEVSHECVGSDHWWACKLLLAQLVRTPSVP